MKVLDTGSNREPNRLEAEASERGEFADGHGMLPAAEAMGEGVMGHEGRRGKGHYWEGEGEGVHSKMELAAEEWNPPGAPSSPGGGERADWADAAWEDWPEKKLALVVIASMGASRPEKEKGPGPSEEAEPQKEWASEPTKDDGKPGWADWRLAEAEMDPR
jgi:hypothetical protein